MSNKDIKRNELWLFFPGWSYPSPNLWHIDLLYLVRSMGKTSGYPSQSCMKVFLLMENSALSMLPPIITIILALLTKEVYMSLIIGIFSGALLFTGGVAFAGVPRRGMVQPGGTRSNAAPPST